MFRNLCGKDSLMNAILVTTMWEDEYAAIGERREQELIATCGFWGALVEEGAQINRHNKTRSSAMSLLRTIARNDRVTISIQKEMVSEHKDLNKTEAGIGLNSDFLLAEQRVMKEMSEALEMQRQARKDQDERSAEEQRQYRETMQKRVDHLNQGRENLKIGLEEMKEQRHRFKVLEGKYRKSQERMRHRTRSRIWKSNTGSESKRCFNEPKKPDLVLFLSGKGFFGGRNGNQHRYNRDLKRLRDENDIRRICALGTNGSWLYHYHTGSNFGCWTCWSDSFATKYPELAAWLDKHQKFVCPRHISLGADGFFYIAIMDNSIHWRIPKSMSKRITGYIGERTVRPIQRLWLGYNHDYVAEISDDDYLCNIENYDNLEGLVGDIDSEGASFMLAMNIEDPRGYILVQELGEAFQNIGTTGNQFDEARW
ncbi:hypothetical protein NOF04DRAFT_1280500 [Fusarium oxysporum II5]|nr:hypothetical protein NOF04DRAFT_1280500 [Fusarium oxysporum II5]